MTDPTEQAILDLLEFIEDNFQQRKAPGERHVIVPTYEYKLCLGFGKGAIDFVIPMRPVPKARARVTKGGFAYTPKRTADAEKVVASYAKQYIKEPLTGPVAMILEFCYEAPKAFSKKDREAALSGMLPKTGRPDLDNLTKLTQDALIGIAYRDDSQIVRLEAIKRYAEHNSIHVRILSV